jgi:hypothetical protein
MGRYFLLRALHMGRGAGPWRRYRG